MRAAALGVSVALAQSPDGQDAFNYVTDVISDAAQIVIDTTECSLVRRQAAILISNLIASIQVQEQDDSTVNKVGQLYTDMYNLGRFHTTTY